jgi:transcriptional regulator of arginine metabolism
MHNARQLPKPERQRLIASLVSRRRIGSQHELERVLGAAGCEVTQATISRDVRELGLEKTRDVLGRPRYVLPERGRRGSDPHNALAAVLAQFGRRVDAAQNIVVV